MEPFFSIVIPSYNRAQFIGKAIESVLEQTFIDWELLIVDDGSTDNTKEVVAAYTDTRIKYIFQQNAERSAARNTGIRHAAGKYICFLDSDDYFEKDNLQNIHSWLFNKNFPKGLFFVQAIVSSPDERKVTVKEEIGPNAIDYLFTHPITPSRACVHSDILKEFNFDVDIVIVEDVILWMKIASKYPVEFLDHIGVTYFFHGDNSVGYKGSAIVKSYAGVRLAEKRYPEIFARITKSAYHSWISAMKAYMAMHHWVNNRRCKSLYWLISAIIEKPNHPQTKYRLNLIFRLLTFQNIV